MRTILPIHLSLTALVIGLLTTSAGQAEEVDRGAMLSASCAGCHGTDGHSPGVIPDISSKSADFIRMAMRDFASGKRESTVMGRHAKGYTEEEIALIAKYLEKRK